MEYLSPATNLPLIGAIVAAVIVLLYFAVGKNQQRGYRTAKVHRALDRDTVIVAAGWSKIIARLSAIDCPEHGQHWGDTAKYGLIKMIGGRTIRLEEHTIDKHGRLVATIYVQPDATGKWVNVNARMIMLGHAWVYRRFYTHLPKDRRDELNKLERWAKTKRVGLWRMANPIPPWDWRRS